MDKYLLITNGEINYANFLMKIGLKYKEIRTPCDFVLQQFGQFEYTTDKEFLKLAVFELNEALR
jgi:uncharacterized protein (DUF608 family)